MALPTFFVIGAAKAGTTSLHYYLGLHPQVQMSAVKETHFFAGPANGSPYALGRIESRDKYELLFDPSVPMRGEACPSYTSYPFREGTPERIKELVPEAKLIYMVRDPVSRTVSHYQHQVSVAGERRPLCEVLTEALANPLRHRETCLSLYHTQLEQYLRHFPDDRILVVDQTDLLADRAATLRQIFSFLSVDETFSSPEFHAELLKTSERRTYLSGYNRLVRRVVAPSLQRVPPPVRRRLRRSVERCIFRPLPTPVLDGDIRAELEALYADQVQRLRAFTGKAFATWSV